MTEKPLIPLKDLPNIPYKPIRKSAYMSYTKCPKQFQFIYDSDTYWNYQQKDSVSESINKGNMFHQGCDEFFEKVNLETFYHLSEETLYHSMRNLFSVGSVIDSWFDYFCKIEVKRFFSLKEKYSWDGISKWYKPKLVEYKIDMKDEIDRTGHVDRVDYFPEEKAYCVVEYKTGPSYDSNKKWVMASIRKETAFYAIMLNNSNVLDAPVKYFALLNPSVEQLTVEKFHHSTFISVNNEYKELIQKIKNNGPFDRNISPLCRKCPYRMPCYYPNNQNEKDYIFGRFTEKNE